MQSPVRALEWSTITHAGLAIPSPSDSREVLKAKYMNFVGVLRIHGEPDGVEKLRNKLFGKPLFAHSRPSSPMPGQGGTRRRRRSYRRRR